MKPLIPSKTLYINDRLSIKQNGPHEQPELPTKYSQVLTYMFFSLIPRKLKTTDSGRSSDLLRH